MYSQMWPTATATLLLQAICILTICASSLAVNVAAEATAAAVTVTVAVSPKPAAHNTADDGNNVTAFAELHVPKYSVKKSKYTIDDLLANDFPRRISGDIDMDPCKSVGFMNDIALPNINNEAEWRAQKYNKTFQQELENLKKEVYHEGLQIEEEGLTEIVRKKTKLTNVEMPSNSGYYDGKQKNDPAIEEHSSGAERDKESLLFLKRPSSVTPFRAISTTPSTIELIRTSFPAISTSPSSLPLSTKHSFHSAETLARIQSNTKDIVDSGVNIPRANPRKLSMHHQLYSTSTSTSAPLSLRRTTLPNRFSNSGGNGGHLDGVATLQGTAQIRRRHRKPKNRRKSDRNPPNTDRRTQRKIIPADFEHNHSTTPFQSTTVPAVNTLGKRHRANRKRKNDKTTRQSSHDSFISSTLPNIELSANGDRLNEMQLHHRVTRAATAKKERIWDYGVIPYEIDGNFSGAHKSLFKQAMRHWENFTCIKFVERNIEDHPNYIVFTERPCGCCSFVGKRGNGPQAISIGKNCDKFGIVVHEIGHVVGFWHEHTRPDRENHVVIEKNNIMNGQEYNFNKLTDEEVNSLGLPYDYDSIMHYARNTFSKGTFLDTILPIEVKGKKRPEIGQRLRLSEGDIAQANLLYKCAKCGRTLQENSGTFSSPTFYSGTVPVEGERCEWRITATHGERIVLNITELNLFKTNTCRGDFVDIRDGYWQKSPLLGRFCGSGRVNEVITSSGSRLLVTYMMTTLQPSFKGFAASYEAICGGELNIERDGHLESPNYPLDYLPNKECVWKITVPKDYQVALKFQSFEFENHDNCVYDYVEIRDGDSADSRLIGMFCGYKIPPDMRSSSNHLYVKFVSDGSVQKAGFSATLMKEVDECETLDYHGCEHDCINTLGGFECACAIGFELHSDKKSCENACGGIIDMLNGTVTSPSFPQEYPLSKDCVWEILAPPQYRITLNFTHFDIEGNNFYQPECEYDSLTVYSKMGEDHLKRHGVFCGQNLPPLITSEGNALRIEFSSDKTVQKSGFSAIFFTDNDECASNNGGCQHECRNTIGSYVCSCHTGYSLHANGHDCKEGGCKFEVTTPQGNIFSPNFPDVYPSRKDCVWHFTTTPGHRIKLIFNTFDLEPHQNCDYDQVSIYDGDSSESVSLGRFCGLKLPHPISASHNEMYMIFKSDGTVQRNGFFATHSTACGGKLKAMYRQQHFYSHARFGDFNYDNRSDCDWTIEAEPGRSVQLNFLSFDLENEATCVYDYVEIYNGIDDSSGQYEKFCGSTKPPDIISMGDALLIRFRSDDTVAMKGFSAAFYAVDPLEDDENMSADSEETRVNILKKMPKSRAKTKTLSRNGNGTPNEVDSIVRYE